MGLAWRAGSAAQGFVGDVLDRLVAGPVDLGGDRCEAEAAGDQRPVFPDGMAERDQRSVADGPQGERIDQPAKSGGDADRLRAVSLQESAPE
jgi:hypothetical protein